MTELWRDRLRTVVLPDRDAMGEAAATYTAERLRALLANKPRVRVIFAAAASQAEMLAALSRAEGIDWSRVELFHLDEYVGLPPGDERGFGAWLDRHLWSGLQPARVERIDGSNPDPAAESVRYAALLADGGIDLALIGIGENGHLAFNDPHVADFEDPLLVKPVEIDETSRYQQVRDGEFATVGEVPHVAITVTMSAILASSVISVVVPGPQKAAAVAATLDGPISSACPASALRRHPDAVLFLEEASASLISHRAPPAARPDRRD
jgi:glucosamine-6-phosphate deaminase